MLFEFLIPQRPVSLQTKNRTNLQRWKVFVRHEAERIWSGTLQTGTPQTGKDLRLTLIYLCDQNPVDVDNIIKPIQDALVGLVYDDDRLISDVESHRRPLTGTFDILNYPHLLVAGILSGQECVYVRISHSYKLLENYLS